MELKIKLLSQNSKMPTRGTEKSVGLDLYAAEDVMIGPRSRKLIPTDIAIEIPEGYYARVVGRSGMTIKRGLTVREGIIDNDYRGNIGIMAFNENGDHFIVLKGEKIAQLILAPQINCDVVETDTLSETERGEKGFGSTGV